jgi:hypothetical protein
LNRYILHFTIANLALTIVAAFLAELFQLKSGSFLPLIAAQASSFFAASAFARDYGRPATTQEKNAFAWRALLSTFVISLVLSVIVLSIFLKSSELWSIIRTLSTATGLTIFFGVMIFVSAIYYFAIRWSFGWYTKYASKSQATSSTPSSAKP